MGSVASCLVTGAAWCCCTATGSLLSSCLGNDKPSTVAPGAASGRRRSVLLLVISIVFAFVFQYAVAPRTVDFSFGNYVVDAWTDGCTDLGSDGLTERCAGNSAVYRAASSATLFFVLAAIAVACKPTANREAWPAKYVLFCFLTLGTCFIPNDPLFDPIYLNVARVGAAFFILCEQIILIDMAYNWNDSWVSKANAADAEQDGSGKRWLTAIIVACAALFVGAITGIALMYHYFSGCGTNMAFMSVTVVGCVLVVAAQLSGEEGSLLSSATIVAYATFLCYTAVSKNPNNACNPLLGEDDVAGIILGVGVTLTSLAWTGWSSTAETKIAGGSYVPHDVELVWNIGFTNLSSSLSMAALRVLSESLVDNSHHEPNEEKKVTGVVTNQDYGTNEQDEEEGAAAVPPAVESDQATSKGLSNSWKLNVVLALVSFWYAMALTGWGSIESGGTVYDPDVGKVSMWMIIASQWLVMALYLWTLLAPRLFPDRDFS